MQGNERLPEKGPESSPQADSSISDFSTKAKSKAKSKRKAQRLPEFLRPAEADALLGAARSERDKLLVLVGLGAGLRCSEMTHLRIEDIDLDGKMLFVRLGKNSKDRYVCLPDFLRDALRSYIGGRRLGWLFPSPRNERKPLTTRAVQYIIGRLREAAGIVRRCSPHTMRHSYATDLLRNGADITDVQRLLGHSSPNITSRYLHCDPARLGGIVQRLSLQRGAQPGQPATAEPFT